MINKLIYYLPLGHISNIIRAPAEYWKPHVLWQIMTHCIILHNMIVKDERDMPENY
jgi:hypothetical protein